MKLYALIFAVAYFTIGCSSNNDSPAMNATGGGNYFTSANLEDVLNNVFSVVNADQLQTRFGSLVLRRLASAREISVEGFTYLSQEQDPKTFGTIYYYSCDGGGTTNVNAGATVQNPTYDVTVTECIVEDETLNGSYYLSQISTNETHRFEPNFDVELASGGSYSISGERFRSNAFAQPAGNIGWTITKFEDSSANTLLLSSFSSTATYDDNKMDSAGFQSKTFTIQADISADWTNGDVLKLTTTSEFGLFGATNNYQTGSFTVIASDGSSMIVDADNGDPATFQVDVIGATGTVSNTFNWGGAYVLPCMGSSVTESRCDLEL